ncbi:MAG: toll/interleukin-1 receptor domain-containing protein [Eubacteriales bacterium]|nr:toll/interleukin-1 receptor domain-containing protein [Eubacteriales bacterium]
MVETRKDIFISYRNDGVGNNFATRISNDLKDSGYSVYFNPDEERRGDFPERLRQAIRVCKDFVCIVTEDYIAQLLSNNKICWTRDELLCARKYEKNIIPLLVNGTTMPDDASGFPEKLQFFPNIDAYVFPEQYIKSPYSVLCGILLSRNDGKNGYRDVYNSSKLFDVDKVLADTLVQAENGDVSAMLTAGIYYYYGISGGKDERKAAFWLKKVSATEGEYAPVADKFIARMYYAGSMPRENQSYEKSYEYHVKSARGDMYSAGQVGFMKTIGSGCDYDYEQTEQYYLSILNSLDNPRKDTLCRFYMSHGEFGKAAKIYETMAETYPEAAFQMGIMNRTGVLSSPFKPDYFEAARYFQMALEGGYPQAAYELGALYFNPTGGLKKDFAKAQKYYLMAAQTNNVYALYMLGYMYSYGHVEKNLQLSIEYFEKAAKQGHILSAAQLALLYQKPEFHNYEKAFNYCKYASDCGDAPSEFVLGTMYLSGRGCEPNEDKAYLCFKHAAENGAPEALMMLKQMDELGI